jgi:hypothetical protein
VSEFLSQHWLSLSLGAAFLVVAGPALWPRLKGFIPRSPAATTGSASSQSDSEQPLTLRGSDQPAPAGTAEYLKSLSSAAPEAPADFLLSQALYGATVAKCQRDWITELLQQQGKPSVSAAGATASSRSTKRKA